MQKYSLWKTIQFFYWKVYYFCNEFNIGQQTKVKRAQQVFCNKE
jgi:hypothetical protein